jgi:hypothetical protein
MEMTLQDKRIKGAKVGILGRTFKVGCPSLPNSKVEGLITEFKGY